MLNFYLSILNIIFIVFSNINIFKSQHQLLSTAIDIPKPVKYNEPKSEYVSVAELHNLTDVKAGIVYVVKENNSRWVYDSKDKKTIANEGTILVINNGKRLKRVFTGDADIAWFGAKSNDINFDNSAIIQKAIITQKHIYFGKNKTYAISKQIFISRINNIQLNFSNSTLINTNYDVKTLYFDHCKSVNIIGGKFTRTTLPITQNNKDQNTLTFVGCTDISVINSNIDRSPEMGICLMSVIGANITNNIIQHTLRDGVYSHYSADLKYIGNKLSYIKDDALSIHDYGIIAQKPELIAKGYQQAGHSIISNNTIYNAIQGISSIGCASINIINNHINKTANAGIAIFNSETLFKGTTARVTNILIKGNILNKCGDTAIVNSNVIANNGQLTTGRAAIYIASNGYDNMFNTGTFRLSKINVIHNTVTESAVNGILCSNIDGLVFNNNTFINCHSNTKVAPQFTGNICEIFNCTKISVYGNSVLDKRRSPLHDSAYLIDNCSGSFNKGTNSGWRSFEVRIAKSPALKTE